MSQDKPDIRWYNRAGWCVKVLLSFQEVDITYIKQNNNNNKMTQMMVFKSDKLEVFSICCISNCVLVLVEYLY